MSDITVGTNNGSSAQFNRNIAKIFLGRNNYDHAPFTNSTYADIFIPAGTLIGRFTAGAPGIELMKSNASDGSQFPRGITREDYTVLAGQTSELYFCTGGDVAEEMILFAGGSSLGDGMNTVVSGVIYRDRIAADTVGIKIVRTADDNTGYDNSLV